MVVWKRLVASLSKANQTIETFIQSRLKRLRNYDPATFQSGEWDYINPHRLTARQKVIFYYLALVRRAHDAGLPRQDSQTPYEYARLLGASLKEEKEALDSMTVSFIEARYSRHDIPVKSASLAEAKWGTLRRLLRNVRNSRKK